MYDRHLIRTIENFRNNGAYTRTFISKPDNLCHCLNRLLYISVNKDTPTPDQQKEIKYDTTYEIKKGPSITRGILKGEKKNKYKREYT